MQMSNGAVSVGTGVTSAHVLAVLGRSAKLKRRSIWPIAVRDKQKGVFVQNRRLTGAYKFAVEIRSRAGHGYFAMGLGMVGTGKSRDEAIGGLIRLVDPAIREVRHR